MTLIVPRSLPPCFVKQGLSLAWTLLSKPARVGTDPQGPSRLCLLSFCFLECVPGTELQFPELAKQTLYQLSHLPVSSTYLFIYLFTYSFICLL